MEEIQADGVLQGKTPAKVTVMPGALRVRVPVVTVPGLHENEPCETINEAMKPLKQPGEQE